MSYEKFHRKGTSRERQARALQLVEQLQQKIVEAEQASVEADKLGTYNSHVLASRLWRRIIYPATRLDQDTTIYREAVRRHIDIAETLKSHKSAQ